MEEFRARPKLEADKLTMDLLRWHGGNFVDCKLLSSEARPAPCRQNRKPALWMVAACPPDFQLSAPRRVAIAWKAGDRR